MKKELKSAFDREDILNTIKFYFYTPHENDMFIPDIHPIPTMDDEGINRYIQYFMRNNVIHFTHKKFVRVFSIYKNYLIETGINYPAYIEIINKLIGDRKLFKKMVFIKDSSYINADINISTNFVGIVITGHHKDSIKKLINYMYNNYDKIYIHLFSGIYNSTSSVDDLIQSKIEEEFNDQMLSDLCGYDSYYDDYY